jgi:hypothetical protein
MKKIVSLSLIALLTTVIFTSCKKEGSTDNSSTEIPTHSDDQSRFSGETDAVAIDAGIALESNPSFAGRTSQSQLVICNAAVTFDTISNPRTITITYNGVNCVGNATRTGVVVLSMASGVHWKNAGAQLNVNFQNLRITRLIDNKSITINGSQTFTNTSGGLLINLPSLGTITHTITSNGMSVTFDNGTQRNWQVAKQRVFTYNNGVVINISGIHTEGNLTNIAEWGINRFGYAFTSATTQSLIVRQDCNFRLVTGQVTHITGGMSATATFGLDENGNAIPCPGNANYYFKLVWTGPNGNSLTRIFPY